MSKKPGVDKETRRAALLLSGMITTPEEELEDFRKKRLGRGSTVELDHLARARAVLLAVSAAVQSDGDDDRALVESLHRLVTKGKPLAPPTSRAAPADDAADAKAEDAADAHAERPDPPGGDQPGDHEPNPEPNPDDAAPAAADDPVPKPPRVGEDVGTKAPALAVSDHTSPWANPAAALAAARPKPATSRSQRAAPSDPAPVPPPAVAPPPLVGPPAPPTDQADARAADEPADDERQTARPASSSAPPPDAADPNDANARDDAEPRHPRAGETAAPPASTTADAGFEIPSSPALPFVEAPKVTSEPAARGAAAGEWALPFQPTGSVAPPAPAASPKPAASPAPAAPPAPPEPAAPSPAAPEPASSEPAASKPAFAEPRVAAPPRFPRADPDDDEPTMASINLPIGGKPARDGEASGSDRGAADEHDTHPAEIGGAALAHMKIPGSPLTLTDYAALCAICGAFPAHLSDTYLRFGLSDHTERYALDETWQAHFEDRPEAQVLWRTLFTQFRAWLTQYGRL